MAHDLFISYSAHDKPIADAVCAALEAERIRCWIAPRDVLPGIPYAEALIDAINGSRILVLLVSSNSNHSPQVMREVERAVSKGILIVPFRIEDVQLCKEMEYYISTPHWLDALTAPMEEHLVRLAQTASMLLAREPPTEAPGAGGEAAHAGTAPEPARVPLPSAPARTPGPATAVSSGAAPRSPAHTEPDYFPAAPAMTTGHAFLRRLASAGIDWLILVALWFVGFAILLAAVGGPPAVVGGSKTFNPVLPWAIAVVAIGGYCGGMLAARGQTLGKMALGLRVVGPDGGNPSFWRAALREVIGKYISGLALFLGYLWMLWDGGQQTWHDKMAHTHVEMAH
jgi:uncharacterized RDD family membrane protein YckC